MKLIPACPFTEPNLGFYSSPIKLGVHNSKRCRDEDAGPLQGVGNFVAGVILECGR